MPASASKVFEIISSLDCVKTWIVTSDGIFLCSINCLTKLKSVSDAAGKPTSISLKPIWQSNSNILIFLSFPIGSMSD